MWRFILVTFAMLGWAFYELSGGSDYAPLDGSLQAANRAASETELASSTGEASPEENREEAQGIVASSAGGADAFEITLAAAQETAAAAEPDPKPWESASASLFSDPVLPPGVQARAAALSEPEPEPAADIRTVSAAAVNMRNGPGTGYSVLAKLSFGDRVEVLNDPGQGWVKLRVKETGRVGWMADFLLENADG
jgi:uncharacterized protein YgiM (DUF1202 family)